MSNVDVLQTNWKSDFGQTSWAPERVFCYQNCSDLLWEKIVLVVEKNFWNSRLKAENLQNFWDQYNNLFKQWKVGTIFCNWMVFYLVPEGFSYSVSHIITYPSKELCSKKALGEVAVSLPWWCQALVLSPPGYSGLFLNLINFS